MTINYYRVGNPPILPSITTTNSTPCPKCGAQECWLLVDNDAHGGYARCIFCGYDIESKPQEQPEVKGRAHGKIWRGG